MGAKTPDESLSQAHSMALYPTGLAEICRTAIRKNTLVASSLLSAETSQPHRHLSVCQAWERAKSQLIQAGETKI